MEAKKARKIIKLNNLINKKNSREIIRFIKDDKKKLNFHLAKKDQKKILEIRKEYNLIRKKNKIKSPRNLALYHIIKNKYEKFSWSKINEHYDFNFNSTNINQRVTLASLLLERVKTTKKKDTGITNIDYKIDKFLNSEIFIKIDNLNKNSFIKLLKSIKKNQVLTIVSPVCPDYSAVEKAPGIYEFTFKKLNSDIGVVTKKVLENQSKIEKLQYCKTQSQKSCSRSV